MLKLGAANEGFYTKVLIDTGSDQTLVNETLYEALTQTKAVQPATISNQPVQLVSALGEGRLESGVHAALIGYTEQGVVRRAGRVQVCVSCLRILDRVGIFRPRTVLL